MNVSAVIQEKTVTNALILEGEGGSLKISRPKDCQWRVQGSLPEGGFDDFGAVQILARDLGEKIPGDQLEFSVEPREGGVIVIAGREKAEISFSPFTLVLYRDSLELCRVTEIQREEKGYLVKGSLREGEALYGSGERFNRVNQRGKTVDIMAIDRWAETEGNSYAPVPFILSSRPLGFLLNRYEYSILDLGAEKKDSWSFRLPGAPLDLYIFAESRPADILRDYADLSGHAPLPASWLFGIQVCRHLRLKEFSSAAGIEAMAQKMEENDFPWDAVIAEGWDCYNFDNHEELRKISAKLHNMGKKMLLYEPCGRVPRSDDTQEQARLDRDLQFKAGYAIRELDGNYLLPENWTKSFNPADNPNPKRVPFVDITNPEALDWWLGPVWGKLVKDIGIDGCKIDFCEQVPDHINLVFHDGRSSSGAHHWYPTLYNTLMYRFYQKHRPEGGMCFSRGGGIGAQRYPFLWAGDQLREFRYLGAILTSVLSAGLSGIPFMSFDMAGYMPARNGDPEEAVFIRGTEMACFSANMQTHGIVTRPYDFPEPIRDLYRIYSKLHQALRPYLLEQAGISCQTGIPLLRHLFLYDPADPGVLDIEDEYMLGSALLVAPVFSGKEHRDIYLPKGNWKNILDGKTYPGSQTLKDFSVPFRQIPVFTLEGNSSRTIGGVLKTTEALLGKLR